MADLNTLFTQATAFIKENRLDDAKRALAEVLRLNPRHEEAWIALASILTDMHQAADCLRRALAINPNNETAKEWLQFAEQEMERQTMMIAPEAADVQIDEPGDENRPVARLGKYLLDYKFISEEQLKQALLAQKHASQNGETKRLGDVLLEQGSITQERLDFALREQHRGFYSLFND